MVARKLSIPLSSVKVKPTNNLVAPNNSTTGGSMGSECVCSAAEFAVADLKAREEEEEAASASIGLAHFDLNHKINPLFRQKI